MRGFPYTNYFSPKAPDKVATLHRLNGDKIDVGDIKIDTGCNGDAKTILLVQQNELAEHHIEHLDIAGGQVVLKFDGAFYTFHGSNPGTDQLVFWPLAVPVADVHEGQEHIDHFENEGGRVHPADEGTRVGRAVEPRFPVSGPVVKRVNPNEDGGVNWPIGGDRPADTGRVLSTSTGVRDAQC